MGTNGTCIIRFETLIYSREADLALGGSSQKLWTVRRFASSCRNLQKTRGSKNRRNGMGNAWDGWSSQLVHLSANYRARVPTCLSNCFMINFLKV